MMWGRNASPSFERWAEELPLACFLHRGRLATRCTSGGSSCWCLCSPDIDPSRRIYTVSVVTSPGGHQRLASTETGTRNTKQHSGYDYPYIISSLYLSHVLYYTEVSLGFKGTAACTLFNRMFLRHALTVIRPWPWEDWLCRHIVHVEAIEGTLGCRMLPSHAGRLVDEL